MSHATTIARDSAKRTGSNLTRRVGAMALSMAVGVAIGFALDQPAASDGGSKAMAANRLSHEEFVRLNTTDLGIAPTQPAAAALTRSVEPVDHFTRINTIELQPLTPRAIAPTVDRHLFDSNVATFEEVRPVAAPGVEPGTGGGYDLNVGSIDKALPAYSQSAIGPR